MLYVKTHQPRPRPEKNACGKVGNVQCTSSGQADVTLARLIAACCNFRRAEVNRSGARQLIVLDFHIVEDALNLLKTDVKTSGRYICAASGCKIGREPIRSAHLAPAQLFEIKRDTSLSACDKSQMAVPVGRS